MSTSLAINLSEKGLMPDRLIRQGIRHMLGRRLQGIGADNGSHKNLEEFVQLMDRSPIAVETDKANTQHYELPAEFFSSVLGEHLKYSCGYWPGQCDNLDLAEASALRLTCERARLENGMRILELGCGWGSLSLWMAYHYPDSEIVAVSNSFTQAEFIRSKAAQRGLVNLAVITADMNSFDSDRIYDRIVSVEMFEHMRNFRELYSRVANWLKPGGLFFKHIFVHRSQPYLFEDNGNADWMARFFFSGGMMPAFDLPLQFSEQLSVIERWRGNGTHYEATANAWLEKMDNAKKELMPLFQSVYGKDFASVWWQRWRMFFMACAELFGYRDGSEWFVGHYLLRKS